MLLSFLLICFLIFMIASLGVRILLTVAFNRAKRRGANVHQQNYTSARPDDRKKEGEVYVSTSSVGAQDKVVEKDMGEYVEFETVKEDK